MADTTKPIEPVVPETTAPLTETAPAVVEPTTETAVPATTSTEAAAPTETAAVEGAAEEKKDKEPAKKVDEPVTSGALGYKQPGFPKSLLFSKKYFWLGDEPVSEKNLSQYLRGEKPDVGNATAAWSSVTGKGLLYFAKKVDLKEHPAGVINLTEAEGITKEGWNEFSFKLHGHKHVFQAKTDSERNGWLLAIEKAIEEATGKKEEVHASQGYKDVLEKLSKPLAIGAAAGAGTAAAAGKAAEPSTSTPAKETTATEPLTRASSSSSDSDVENKKSKKSKSKSRSISRGKRASIFGSLLGKKDEHEAKKEEKKEEAKAEETAVPAAAATTEPAVTSTEPAAPAGAVDPVIAAPVIAPIAEPEVAKSATEVPATETATETPAAAATDAPAPKPTKRGSVFGSFFQNKIRSPTTEKKESEVGPAAPPKDEPILPATAAATTEETPALAPEAEPIAETKPTETAAAATTTPTAPKKENFLSKLKNKAKSPTSEHPPKLDEPKKSTEVLKDSEAPVIAPLETAPETAPAVPEKTETEVPTVAEPETKAEATKPEAPVNERRKSSFLANLTSNLKKDKAEGETSPGEKKHSTLGGIFRNPSKAIRSNKEAKKETATPAKTAETSETAAAPAATETAAPTVDPALEGTPAAEPATNGTKSIGDVVPEAITVGGAPESSPAVKAAA